MFKDRRSALLGHFFLRLISRQAFHGSASASSNVFPLAFVIVHLGLAGARVRFGQIAAIVLACFSLACAIAGVARNVVLSKVAAAAAIRARWFMRILQK
jgi:hypothetical protein